MNASRTGPLHQLARLYGVQTAYYDMTHHRRQASAEALLAVLRSMGAPVASLADVPSALRQRRQSLWQQVLEPVALAWDGWLTPLELCLASQNVDVPLTGDLVLENGEKQRIEWGNGLPVTDAAEIEGTQYLVKQVPLHQVLPWGYHRLVLETPSGPAETLIIAAPLRAYSPGESPQLGTWGAFLPLYSLHTQRSWGSGDFSDMESLVSWVAGMGGGAVATLPLLPTFLDEPFEPSPYAPVSRLLWNEFYIDVTRAPELERCRAAQDMLQSSSFQQELDAVRTLPLVDYRRQMWLKRRVLEELARFCFAEDSQVSATLRHFLTTHPAVEDYARFRATRERQRASWQSWPSRLKEGVPSPGDYAEDARQYYAYAQWLAQRQAEAMLETGRQKGAALYLDLPLGVHPGGFDVWREKVVFPPDVTGGAPPDIVFTNGQDWGFPPTHPEMIREQRYRYVIECLRHHLRHTGLLRIDHVMSLHRLFWIPKGMEPGQGAYVRYPAEEVYAILALESHRHNAVILGEDLGTVPPEVRPAMIRHGFHRMYVVQYELASDSPKGLRKLPADATASVNTHDMPPFAAFWKGTDIQDRLELGLVNRMGASAERRTRRVARKVLVSSLQRDGWLPTSSPDSQSALRATLFFLAASDVHALLINLEDLWQETRPQNIPSTPTEFPNWCRKARHPLEVFSTLPQVVEVLGQIDAIRNRRSYS